MVNMPQETIQATEWAISQNVNEVEITKNMPTELVDKVREYFNDNNISYTTFSYDDLIPYLLD